MSRLIAMMILIAMLGLSSSAPAAQDDPEILVKRTVEDIIKVWEEHRSDPKEGLVKVKKIVTSGFFDWEYMAERSLRNHWSRLTKSQRQSFVQVFIGLMVRRYVLPIPVGSNKAVVAIKKDNAKDKAKATHELDITISVVNPSRPDVDVTYRLFKQGSAWTVRDVSPQGVSMIENYREQFNSDLKRNASLDLLIREMRAKIDAPFQQ